VEVILGLDLVELVIATEAAFGVAIPDAVAAELDTPRKVIDYLQSRLATSDTPDCLSQRAFYRIRGAVMQRFERSRDSLAPDTRIGDVLPHSGAEAHWRQLGAELGADQWPKWRDASWLRRQLGTGPATLGDLANQLARTNPAAVKGAHGAWTRGEIEQSFLTLLEYHTGVDMSKHSLDSRFTRDMGLD
jgi:hypothetical protein